MLLPWYLGPPGPYISDPTNLFIINIDRLRSNQNWMLNKSGCVDPKTVEDGQLDMSKLKRSRVQTRLLSVDSWVARWCSSSLISALSILHNERSERQAGVVAYPWSINFSMLAFVTGGSLSSQILMVECVVARIMTSNIELLHALLFFMHIYKGKTRPHQRLENWEAF